MSIMVCVGRWKHEYFSVKELTETHVVLENNRKYEVRGANWRESFRQAKEHGGHVRVEADKSGCVSWVHLYLPRGWLPTTYDNGLSDHRSID